jgi:hypothetical protein
MAKKLTLSEKQKLVYEWASQQRVSLLASLIVHTSSIKTLNGIIQDNNLKQ